MSDGTASPVRVCVLGIRGIENVQGGVETHAAELYRRLIDLGCEVDVIVRTPYSKPERTRSGAIRIHRVWAPTRSGLEAFLHSLLGVFYAARLRPDILHIHAVGPSIVTPIARLLGLRVVVTHHGPDYDRDKWGAFARSVLKLGERWGMRYSNARVAISHVIQSLIRKQYSRDSALIANGVNPAKLATADDFVRSAGLVPQRYFLMVSRVVPEKRQLDLVAAFAAAQVQDWKLVLVGGLGDDSYSRRVTAAASAAGAVLTGFQSGDHLRQLYSHAGTFILPSSHEGLPIALLEALSFGLPVIASDIPANLEIGLDDPCYFPLGNIEVLASRLSAASEQHETNESRAARRTWVAERYNWDTIAQQTLLLYRSVLGAP